MRLARDARAGKLASMVRGELALVTAGTVVGDESE
jgi:hypothetical protein